MHAFEIRIRYGDVDPMGWVYYGNYLRFFEIGRAEMLRALGMSYRALEDDQGVLLPVLEARARYFVGARYDERVTIESGVLTRGRASMRFGYRLSGERGQLLCAGFTEHCTITRDGKPCRPPKVLVDLLAQAPPCDEALLALLREERAAF